MFDLIPWRDRSELSSLRREIDSLFDRFFEGWPFRTTATRQWIPSVDVSETAKEVIVQAELPGMDPKDIDISIQGNVLTLKGERKQEKEEEGANYHRIERSFGSFSRTLQLPAEVDMDKVSAVYRNGILKITMPKTEAASVRRIEVKTA
ncbi:MAG: Hsp20/alpha crystallin family protein [Thermodesulfobacteriota bacterium]